MWYMNEKRNLLQQQFREYAQREIRPLVDKFENEEATMKPIIKEIGKYGWTHLTEPEELTGHKPDYITYGLLLEEFSKESINASFLVYLDDLFKQMVLFPGTSTPGQIDKFLKPALKGDLLLGLAGNEDHGGNMIVNTTAKKVGDEYILNGSKSFITESDVSDVFIVEARTAPEINWQTMEGIDTFYVPRNTPGFENGHIEKKIGLHASRTGSISFNNVHIPAANKMPTPLGLFNASLTVGSYGAIELGAAEQLVEYLANYLKHRDADGGKLWTTHEYMRFELGKLQARIIAFKHAVFGHMANYNEGNQSQDEASALKTVGAKLLKDTADVSISLMGGLGEMYEGQIERYLRDVEAMEHACISNNTAIMNIGNNL